MNVKKPDTAKSDTNDVCKLEKVEMRYTKNWISCRYTILLSNLVGSDHELPTTHKIIEYRILPSPLCLCKPCVATALIMKLDADDWKQFKSDDSLNKKWGFCREHKILISFEDLNNNTFRCSRKDFCWKCNVSDDGYTITLIKRLPMTVYINDDKQWLVPSKKNV